MGFFGKIFDSIFAPPGALDDIASALQTDHRWMFESSPVTDTFRHDDPVFNPTTGLPMVSGIGSIDVGGHTWCEPTTLFCSDPFPNHSSYWDNTPSHDFGSCGMSGGMDFGSCTPHWEP